MRVRLAMLPLAISIGLVGCRESIGENIPRQQAVDRPWSYPVYEMTPSPLDQPGSVLHADGRVWHAYDAPHAIYGPAHGVQIPRAMLRPVAASDGVALYALATDQSPFVRLYAPLGENRWRVMLPAAF